jgi:hypothetical protein
MKIILALGLPLLAVAAIPSIQPAADSLSFRVRSGTQLARSFESRQEISQDEAEILLNGQPFPSGKGGGMTAIQSQALEVNDDFVEVANGSPRKLRREFVKIESSGEQTTQDPMDSGDQTDTRRAKSELEGKTVVFDWDEAKQQFKRSFDPEGPEEKMLAGLTEDLDFRALLPAKPEVAADDTWSIDVGVIKSIFLPGGNLALQQVDSPKDEDESGEGEGMLDGDDPAAAFDGLTGKVNATYKGTREVDGVSCGVIAIDFKVSATRDLPGKPTESGGEIHIEHINAFLSLEGEGELVWNLSAGCARSFNMSAKIKNQLEIPMKVVSGDKKLDITRKMQMSGTYDLKVKVEKR